MFDLTAEHMNLTRETLEKLFSIFEEYGITCADTSITDKIIDVVSNGIMDALHKGAGSFYCTVAERIAKVEIEGDDSPDGVTSHVYWNTAASFLELEDAKAYIATAREKKPGAEYGIFVGRFQLKE